jgi:group I intron endonuclease
MVEFVVYLLKNNRNHKFFVGSTNNIKSRMYAHLSALKHQKHSSKTLQSDYNEHGKDCLSIEIAEKCTTRQKAYIAEQRWLDEHYGKSYCYNASSVAFGGPIMKGHNHPKYWKGKKNPNITGDKNPMKRTEVKAKMAGKNNPMYGIDKEKHPMYGRKGFNNPNSKLNKRQVDKIKTLLKQGKLSQTEIAKMFGVSNGTISEINTGKRYL